MLLPLSRHMKTLTATACLTSVAFMIGGSVSWLSCMSITVRTNSIMFQVARLAPDARVVSTIVPYRIIDAGRIKKTSDRHLNRHNRALFAKDLVSPLENSCTQLRIFAGHRPEDAEQQPEAWRAPLRSSWRQLGAWKILSGERLERREGSVSRVKGAWNTLEET